MNQHRTQRTAARAAFTYTLAAVAGSAIAAATGRADDFSNYGQARDFLAAHTSVVELTGEDGERVAICPEYQGRVMTSTTGDLQGSSLGWINKAFISKGEPDKHFNNYGGEDRLWLGPEGGPFSLWFAPGAEQDLVNWITPPALNDGAFKVVSSKEEPYYRMTREMKFGNAAKTQFHLEVTREIRLQKVHHFAEAFGADAQSALAAGRLKLVGFQTNNTITNRGAAMTREKGLVSIWSLGQFPAGARTLVIVPYVAGDEAKLGPVVNSDYFGTIPNDRLRVNPQAAWFLADGRYRSKIGISQSRVKPMAGALDMAGGVLTLVHFSAPSEPSEFSYANNQWGRQAEPYRGDVFNSYNDGPPETGGPALGGFFELESLSPAAQLPTGKSISHTQTTFHIVGDALALARVAKAALGVDVKVNDVAGTSK
ncbi:MAG: DUF6786 family protein [Pirellulales bacterium]